MKKTLLSLSLVALGAASAFSQGTVAFKNDSSTLVRTNNNGNIGSANNTISVITVGLYGGTNNASSNSLSLLATVQMSAAAGRFNYLGGAVSNTFIAGGAVGTFQVRAWSGNFATYEAAYSQALLDGTTLVGGSTIWTQATGNPNVAGTPPPPPGIFAPDGGFTGLTVTTITPEPGTIALGVLGVGSLLALRRRKS